MIGKGLFTQIAMIIISIVIVITYVKPEFVKIGGMQDEISVYNAEIEKVSGVNTQLAVLKSKMDSVSQENKRKLQIYMPDSIDDLNVIRDMGIIYSLAGFDKTIVKYTGFDSNLGKGSKKSNSSKDNTYSAEVEGDYDKIKNLFGLLEMNHYPLEVVKLEIKHAGESADSSGGPNSLLISSDFVSYSFQEPEIDNVIKF